MLANGSNLNRYSIDITKSKGDKGSPYLNPFPPLNLSLPWPLRWIKKLTEVIQGSIHLANVTGNLRAVRSSLRKFQWMESKAF